MNRRVLRLGAIIGAATVSTLAVAPAFAATPVSQATAQSIQLSIAGNSAVSQIVTSTNDGTAETKNDASTVPPLAGIIPGNNALSAGVGVQNARSFKDGTSYACAGVAGTGGGLVTVGNSSCNIDGEPLTLDLGSLDLDVDELLGGEGVITSALDGAIGDLLDPILGGLQTALTQLTDALADTPLGEIGISGGLSAIEASCTADPDKAIGRSEIVDTSGNNTIPISLSLPGVAEPLVLANLDVSMPGKPGGTDVLVNLDSVTQAIIDAVETQIETMLGGAIAGLAPAISAILQPIQDSLVEPLVDALTPVLEAVSDNILRLTVNDVTPGDGGKSVKVTTLAIDVLPAAEQFVGAALISGKIGQVSCGPNNRVTTPPTTPEEPENPESPEVPTVVASGVAGQGNDTARIVLGATAALMLLAGTAGIVGYRRSLLNK